MQHLSCWYIVSFFFHFQRIFHSHLTFSIIENNNYTTIIVILLVVVVVVVVGIIVQRLKMAVISINLRNAISLIKKKKSDNLTTISGNINTLCLLSNSRTTISVYSPIKHGCEEKRTFWYLVRVELCIVDWHCSECARSESNGNEMPYTYIYLHTHFFHHIVL